MGEVPEIMFQQPGRQPEAEKKATGGELTTAPAPWADVVANGYTGTGTGDESAAEAAKPGRVRAPRARKSTDPVFPVHTVTPHPLAVQRAQEILEESGGSYTKILPGDEPGTIIIR